MSTADGLSALPTFRWCGREHSVAELIGQVVRYDGEASTLVGYIEEIDPDSPEPLVRMVAVRSFGYAISHWVPLTALTPYE